MSIQQTARDLCFSLRTVASLRWCSMQPGVLGMKAFYQDSINESHRLQRMLVNSLLTHEVSAICRKLVSIVSYQLSLLVQNESKNPKVSVSGTHVIHWEISRFQLSLHGQQVPFASEPVKFLGQTFEIPWDTARIKESISLQLQTMLHSVDSCPLTEARS